MKNVILVVVFYYKKRRNKKKGIHYTEIIRYIEIIISVEKLLHS